MMAQILVTGAAGFIGSHVTERLLRRGDQVIGLDNFDSFYCRALKERNLRDAAAFPTFRLIELDIREADLVRAVFRHVRPTHVVHLAARAGVRPSLMDPAAYVDTNIQGTVNMLRACEGLPVAHFVFASSSSVYGDAARAPFRETDHTDEPASPYAATKKAGEGFCHLYHRLLGMDVTCLRFFTVYGPRQRPDLAIHKFVRLIDAGEPVPFFGDGSTSRDYTYVDDTVSGILAALDRPASFQIYNLGRGDPIPLSRMVRQIERALGRRAVLDRRPDQPGDVTTTCADVTRAREDLGYEPRVPFEEGIDRFVRWWREIGAVDHFPAQTAAPMTTI
jgi:UDP-glucuronate 4-epimerase